MIEWRTVTKRYFGSSAPALADVTFEVADGEIVGLVGLNGAGKTTAMRVACGISRPTAGTVRVDGRDIQTEKVLASQKMGWVPELPNVDPDRRALALLRYFGGFYGLSRADATQRGRDLLRLVGLEGSERTRVRKFSQGMMKRFNLAAVLVGDPSNLLLDEVLNGIDPQGIQFVRNWATELRSQGKAVLLSSHQLTEVQRIADRVVFLHRGRLLRVIRRSELEEQATGETRVRLRISNLDPAGLAFLGTLGQVAPWGDAVMLTGREIDLARLNRELVQRGYSVVELQVESTSLEDYFLRLVGQAG
jgi:ABC-2 type transport system ATP-binding protein